MSRIVDSAAGDNYNNARGVLTTPKSYLESIVKDAALLRPLTLGTLRLEHNVLLAPMAGVTDLPFRLLCREQGAAFAYTEMISAKGVHYKSAASFELARTVPEEGPLGVQLFGSEPEIMAEAAKIFVDGGASLIDVNMGCPMRKITGNGEGSALMRDPALITRITEAIVHAVDVPVTVKLRRGFDTGKETCVDCAKAAEQGGAAAVTVHGRFREEYYSGRSDWGAAARVKAAVRIPVILSGDVVDRESALAALRTTGVDGVMIGRASMGDPWIFRWITGNGGLPAREERLSAILRHLELLREFKGERTAASEFRKHAAWYLKGLPGSAAVRDNICKTSDVDAIRRIVAEYLTTLT